MVVALTTTTFVALAPPNVTLAPLWKPVPLMVTFCPPDDGPLGGVTEVTVTLFAVGGVTVMLSDLVSLQPAAVVTVTCRVSVPAAPAVKVMAAVPWPRLMAQIGRASCRERV